MDRFNNEFASPAARVQRTIRTSHLSFSPISKPRMNILETVRFDRLFSTVEDKHADLFDRLFSIVSRLLTNCPCSH
jgi:hypothetical protein